MKLLDTIIISIFISIFVFYLCQPKVIEHQEGIVDTKSIQNLGEIAGKILTNNKLEIASNVDILGNLNIIPNGTIVAYNQKTPPPGWALCNGQDIPGFGKVPDLRFKFILGNCDDTSTICTDSKKALQEYNIKGSKKLEYDFGKSAGDWTHVLTVDEMPEHTHNPTFDIHDIFKSGAQSSGNNTNWFDMDGYVGAPKLSLSKTGGNMPHNNMPPYCILTYIIKIPYKKIIKNNI